MFQDDDSLHPQEHIDHNNDIRTSSAPMLAHPESSEAQPPPRKKARRGFAAMSPEKQKEIASLGGKAAHAKGTAHEFSPEEAREAGRKGGQAAQKARQQTKH